MTVPDQDSQAAVISFLKSGRAFSATDLVDHVQTHGAHVFLCGNDALKIKRAVRYDYLDQSTPDRRRALLQRELDLNRPTAPMIYRDVVPVTQAPGTGLELNGAGPAVEWVLRMHRFAPECEMTAVAANGGLTDPVAEALGRTIQRFHATCPVRTEPGDVLIGDILDELARVLAEFDGQVGGGLIAAVLRGARAALSAQAPLLRARSAQGHVRRVHGDLHLRNLLLIDGQPVLFDALEFDERLATCDVLYDLAFLLMDLCQRDLGRPSNAAMTAYLLCARADEDSGLAALPLFLSVRAAIRAMVVLQTDQATGHVGANTDEARRYLSRAIGFLVPRPPVLIAVGGVSGTGKTVLSRDLAPDTGACPGAVHLRSDTERKAQAGPAGYATADRSAVYDRVLARADHFLAAGRSVILDATFLDPAQRTAAVALAARHEVAFRGLWLTAPPSVLMARVTARCGDASDADAAVVRAQLAAFGAQTPGRGWLCLDADGPAETTRAAAFAALADLTGGIDRNAAP